MEVKPEKKSILKCHNMIMILHSVAKTKCLKMKSSIFWGIKNKTMHLDSRITGPDDL